MSFLRILFLLMSLGLVGLSVIVRYDVFTIPIVAQVVSNAEFEVVLASYLLLLLAYRPRRST